MKRQRALLLSTTVLLALCGACGWWLHRERQQYALNRQLIDVLEHGDTTRALALVNAGADPNTRCASSPPPTLTQLLHSLLYHKPLINATPTAFILVCGIDRNPTTGRPNFGQIEENLPLLRVMLAHGADVNARAQWNRTPLHYASIERRLHTIELLLQHYANVNVQDQEGAIPLMWATSPETASIARLLLAHGANPNIQDKEGSTCLHSAVVPPSSINIIVLLLARGADPNIRNNVGDTPLTRAQELERSDLVRLLKQHSPE